MDTWNIVETGIAALMFCATFIVGNRKHPFQTLISDTRTLISFAAGMSTAYVFVHAMPELHDARHAFASSVSMPLRYEGMAVYFFSMIGFLVFYGLDHLHARLQRSDKEGQAAMSFKVHVGGFAAYVWVMAYLLLHNLEDTRLATALYAVAITFHFLTIDYSLRNKHGTSYEQVGRFVLAGASFLGWVAGLLFALPDYALALLVAFTSGAIIMNSAIMELPTEKDGRFLPFVIGGLVYGVILLPL